MYSTHELCCPLNTSTATLKVICKPYHTSLLMHNTQTKLQFLKLDINLQWVNTSAIADQAEKNILKCEVGEASSIKRSYCHDSRAAGITRCERKTCSLFPIKKEDPKFMDLSYIDCIYHEP